MASIDLLSQLFLLLPVFSIIFSIFSLSIAIQQYRLSRKTQILRPHSDRLMEVLKHWLETNNFLPSIKNVVNIPEEHELYMKTELTFDLISSLSLALQHLKSGYFQIFLKLTELEKQIEGHNRYVNEFIDSLYSTIKRKMGLSESSRNNRYAYYRRIISYTLRKMLVGYPEIDPEIVERKPGPGYELRWGGAALIIGNKEDCEKGLKLIAESQSSDDIVQKAKDFHEKAKELNIGRDKLKETLYYEVISKIQVGGVIQGKCDACSR